MTTTRSKVWTARPDLLRSQTPSLQAPPVRSAATAVTLISGIKKKTRRPAVSRSSAEVTNGHEQYEKHVAESNEESAILLTETISRLTVSDQQSRILRKSPSAKSSTPLSAKNSAKLKRPTSQGKFTNLTDIADLILHSNCKNIIVMAGAGISTASGIPDFRTPGTGLYDNLLQYSIPYPEAIFDINYFTSNPRPFFSLAKELYPGKYKPNYIHYFVRMLHEKRCLLRLYTQNIDGLERMAGIPSEKLVEAHGSFSTASCHLCYTPFPAKEAQDCIMNGNFPRCKICSGVVKPDIVFFGEDLPKRFYEFTKDFANADLLIIMGTSLEIKPFASMVNSVRPNVPRLLLNRNAVGPFKKKTLKNTDVVELGELTESTRKFAQALQWQKEIEELMKTHSVQIEISTPSTSVLGKGKCSIPSPSPATSKPNSKARATDHLNAAKLTVKSTNMGKDQLHAPNALTNKYVKKHRPTHNSFGGDTSSSDNRGSESSETSV